MITHAWSYVWPAYGLSWAAIGLYTLSLWVRRPRGRP
jgi:hypothetical protein